MTRDGPEITRRRLLGGLGAVGAVGGGAGAITAATLRDGATLGATVTAGAAGIDVECVDGDCSVADGTLSFGVDGLVPGASGSRRFRLRTVDNPLRLWMRTACPASGDALADELAVRLSIDLGCDGTERQLFPESIDDSWGTLREFQTALADGRRLDDPADPCVSPDGSACLRLDYRLPDDARPETGADSEIDLELYAEQCRHVPESEIRNPFAGIECDPVPCPTCVRLGRLEIQGDRLEPGTYEFDELADRFGDDGHGYELEVKSVDTKDDGEPVCVDVALLRDRSSDTRLCEVRVKGGPERWTYEVDPPRPSTDGSLCTEPIRTGEREAARRPAISYVDVSVCVETGGDGGEEP